MRAAKINIGHPILYNVFAHNLQSIHTQISQWVAAAEYSFLLKNCKTAQSFHLVKFGFAAVILSRRRNQSANARPCQCYGLTPTDPHFLSIQER